MRLSSSPPVFTTSCSVEGDGFVGEGEVDGVLVGDEVCGAVAQEGCVGIGCGGPGVDLP